MKKYDLLKNEKSIIRVLEVKENRVQIIEFLQELPYRTENKVAPLPMSAL